MGVLGSGISFTHVAPAAFAVHGDVQVELFVSCGIATGSDPLIPTPMFALYRNDERLSHAWILEPWTCLAGDVLRFSSTLALVEEAAFAPGDTLTLTVVFFSTNPGYPVENLHILVEGTSHPTRIEAAGLTGPLL